MKTHQFYSVFISVLLSFISISSYAGSFLARVKAISDGDSIRVISEENGGEYIVRMYGIDTPEVYFKGQTQGDSASKAKNYLKALLPPEALVEIEYPGRFTERNGRVLGIVKYNQQDINLKMLESGWAYFYMIAPYNEDYVAQYIEAAHQAVLEKRGLFSGEFSILEPYRFRMKASHCQGTNFLADYETKVIYPQEDYNSVPHWRRIFFKSQQSAFNMGYTPAFSPQCFQLFHTK